MPSVILSIVILHLPQKIWTLNAIPNSFQSQYFPYLITQDHRRCIKQTVLLSYRDMLHVKRSSLAIAGIVRHRYEVFRQCPDQASTSLQSVRVFHDESE
jgi:hypothetical protein